MIKYRYTDFGYRYSYIGKGSPIYFTHAIILDNVFLECFCSSETDWVVEEIVDLNVRVINYFLCISINAHCKNNLWNKSIDVSGTFVSHCIQFIYAFLK
jgi:hypothetical protein